MKLMEMIEAYGQAMSQAKPRVAAKRLAQVEQALNDDGARHFDEFWNGLGGHAVRADGGTPEFMKTVMSLGWYQARRSLVYGDEPKHEFTPEYFAKMTAAHIARQAAKKRAAAGAAKAVVSNRAAAKKKIAPARKLAEKRTAASKS